MSNWLTSLYWQLRTICSGEQGQGLTEYVLILALIALVAIVALSVVGGDASDELTSIGSSIPS
jgi:Flp pilus assembly pilin Flp